MKKIISLVIVLSILCSSGIEAFADTDINVNADIRPMWSSIIYISSNLSINALGVATCTSTMSIDLLNGKSVLKTKLQKLNSAGNWETIFSWIDEGKEVCAVDHYRAVSKGKYRIVTTGEAYDEDGDFIESGTNISIERTY